MKSTFLKVFRMNISEFLLTVRYKFYNTIFADIIY